MGQESLAAEPTASISRELSLEVTNVTGTRSYRADVDPSLSAEIVCRTMSQELNLPRNVPWGLRRTDSAEFLEADKAIGEQVENGDQVTLTPRAHLG